MIGRAWAWLRMLWCCIRCDAGLETFVSTPDKKLLCKQCGMVWEADD